MQHDHHHPQDDHTKKLSNIRVNSMPLRQMQLQKQQQQQANFQHSHDAVTQQPSALEHSTKGLTHEREKHMEKEDDRDSDKPTTISPNLQPSAGGKTEKVVQVTEMKVPEVVFNDGMYLPPPMYKLRPRPFSPFFPLASRLSLRPMVFPTYPMNYGPRFYVDESLVTKYTTLGK